MLKLLSQNIKLILGFAGIGLIALSTTFHVAFLKVEIDRLLAEVGALLLLLGVLHFTFEFRLRREMLREVAGAVLGNERLYSSGLADCLADSTRVEDKQHWEATNSLTVGLQYSPRFVEDFHAVIARRAAVKKRTKILVLGENSAAARYLKESKTGSADIAGGVARIHQIVQDTAKAHADYVTIKTHDRVLRYSFIRTDESIWIKFYTNSSARVTVPALKVRAGTLLYHFFDADIKRLDGTP